MAYRERMMPSLDHLLIAYLAYFIGTASPGPGNLSIMATSLEQGRPAGMAMACGIVTGSQCWGISAAIGLGAVMVVLPSTFIVLRIVGGAYLLWLAYRAARQALVGIGSRLPISGSRSRRTSLWPHYLRGFGIQITNPKAILVWMTTITLGLPGDDTPWAGLAVVAGCLVIGLIVFSTYALVFSNTRVVEVYTRVHRWVNGGVAIFFALAGISLILGH
jgi:threonine efflux protein